MDNFVKRAEYKTAKSAGGWAEFRPLSLALGEPPEDSRYRVTTQDDHCLQHTVEGVILHLSLALEL